MPRPRSLLVLCGYPPGAAATRFRLSAYLDALREAGIEADLQPFIDEPYFARMYRPGGFLEKALPLARFSLERVLLAARARRYDAVYVQREAALVGPPLLERFLAHGLRMPFVYDLDDPLWLEPAAPDGSWRARFPRVIGMLRGASKGDAMMASASAVVAGSETLARHARALCNRVIVLPTVVPRGAWRPLPGRLDGALLGDPPVVGWIGTHSTAPNLQLALPALERLAAEGHRFVLRLRGAPQGVEARGFPVENLPWRRDQEIDDFAAIDVGLGPLTSDPWSEGKSGFKQLQYMAVGVPMVSSLVGGTRDFLRHDENALIAASDDDWYRGLKALLTEIPLRARLARAGRALVETTYCIEAQAPRLIELLDSLAPGPRRLEKSTARSEGGYTSPWRSHSPKRSPIMRVGRCVLAVGMVGIRLASATTRPSTPRTRPRPSVAAKEPSAPMGTVPEGWYPESQMRRMNPSSQERRRSTGASG